MAKWYSTYLFIFLIICSLVTSCSFIKKLQGDKSEEARTLLKSAEKKLASVRETDRQMSEKMNRLIQMVFVSMGKGIDLKTREESKAILDEIKSNLKIQLEALKSANDTLKQARQIKLTPRYRKYLQLKQQAAEKRIDIYSLGNPLFLALEKVIVNEDPESIRLSRQIAADYQSKLKAAAREVEGIEKNAAELAKDYPSEILQ